MHKILLSIIFLFHGTFLIAQNITYLNSDYKRINSQENAVFKYEIIHDDENKFSVYKSVFHKGKLGKPELQSTVIKKAEQVFYVYDETNRKDSYQIMEITDTLSFGNKIRLKNSNNEIMFSAEAIQLFPLILHGKCTVYDMEGVQMSEQMYNNGEKIGEKMLFHPADSNKVITQNAEFSTGSRGFYIEIAHRIKFPINSIKNGIYDDVYIKFMINEDGTMSNISVAKYKDKELAKEGIRVITSIKTPWVAALSDEQKIPVWHYAKISFNGMRL